MSYKVLTIPPFDKQLKKLVKKYPSLKVELADLIKALKTEPGKGTALGNECYKIRLAISSKGKGKSGGARVITYFAINDSSIFYYPFMTNRNKQILRIRNCSIFLP